jgi:hypothetical protein
MRNELQSLNCILAGELIMVSLATAHACLHNAGQPVEIRSQGELLLGLSNKKSN